MRIAAFTMLLTALLASSSAEARLFWQTFGSVVPNAAAAGDGCQGCSWNSNQDYFVPRHASTCRYDLFSPCKVARTNSPACRWSHQFYPGYCGIYRPCHYGWRNHVYGARCGCGPAQPYCGPLRPGYCGTGYCGTGYYETGCEPWSMFGEQPQLAQFLPGVESGDLETLGTIPTEQGGLTAGLGLGVAGVPTDGLSGLGALSPLQSLPMFNPQQPTQFTQPMPSPSNR